MINSILILIVLFTTTGFSVSLHYCCDSLVSLAVNENANTCCPVENDCCDNETKHIQLEEDLTIQSNNPIQKIEMQETIINLIIIEDNVFSVAHKITSNFINVAPPEDLQENLASLQSFLL